MRIILVAALALLLSGPVRALDPFVISDIRVEGLQRISEGTGTECVGVDDDPRLVGEPGGVDGGLVVAVVVHRPGADRERGQSVGEEDES